MLVGSTFSGVGGLDLGLARAGFGHAFFAESDAYRRAVLAARFAGVPIYDDVRGVARTDERSPDERASLRHGDASAIPPGADERSARRDDIAVDLLCGGFPCQDLSIAGRRRGLAGERSGLFHEFVRVADALRPRWVLLENVPGLLSSNDGRDLGIVLGSLADLGYGWAYRILDARHFGVPQRRRRVFIVGHLGGDSESALRALCEGCAGDSAPRECSWTRPTSRVGGRVADTLTSGSHPGSNMPGRRREDDVNLVGALTGTSPGGGWRVGADEAAAGQLVTAKYLTASDRYDADTEDFVVAVSENQRAEVLETPYARQITSGGGKPGQGYQAIRNAAGVRRLTPVECERLMSWPDQWTAPDGIRAPDSRRYAACGDGVVANVAEWIGRGILAEDAS